MSESGTDIRILKKGLKSLIIALPLLFLGPYLITLGFLNKDNSMLYVFLAFGLTTAIGAVFFAWRGINTIIDAIFGEKKK